MRKHLKKYDVGTCDAKLLRRALMGLLSLGLWCIGFSIQPVLAQDSLLAVGQNGVDGRVIERIRINPSLVYEVNIADVAETAAFEPDFAFAPLDVPDPPVVGNVLRSIAREAGEFGAGLDRTVFGAGSNPSQLPASSFQALDDNNARVPPDTSGAVGLEHIMTVLNTQIRIQDRAGSVFYTIPLTSFWTPPPPAQIGVAFDPQVVYDPFASRFYFTVVSDGRSPASAVRLAVSLGPNPVSTVPGQPAANWTIFAIDADPIDGMWADRPSIGFSRDWIAVQVDMFDVCGESNCADGIDNDGDQLIDMADNCSESSCTDGVDNDNDGLVDEGYDAFNRTHIYLFDKQAIISGAPPPINITTLVFVGFGRGIKPAVDYDDTPGIMYLLQSEDDLVNTSGNRVYPCTAGQGEICRYAITGTIGNEVASPPQIVTFAGSPSSWDFAPPDTNGNGQSGDAGPQQGSTVNIHTGDARIQNVVRRNGSLYGTQHIFLPAGGSPTRSAVQWFELTLNGGVVQRGLIDDSSGNMHYAYPSIAVNQTDDVLIGYSSFSTSQYASASYSYRVASDANGTLRNDMVLKAGEAKYVKTDGSGRNRWGDYSATMVDPYNDIDMWTIQEYADLPFSSVPPPPNPWDRWAIQWGRFGGGCGPAMVWSLAAPGSSPPPNGKAMAYDSKRSRTVLFGGTDGVTWEWDGINWTGLNPTNAPSPRFRPALAYDAARGVTVLFGGFDLATGGTISDTWEWNGSNWTQRSAGGGGDPAARYLAQMVYDANPNRGVVVLFGGYDGSSTVFGDTWEWDGSTWAQRSPSTSPSARTDFAMTYDTARQVTVLHGGSTATTVVDETWEYGGTNWTQVFPTNTPGIRTGHAMAFDIMRGVSVLYGSNGSGTYSDRSGTWEYDGTNWALAADSVPGTPLVGHSMAYDLARRQIVLLGDVNGPTFGTFVYPTQSVSQAYLLTGTADGTGWSWCVNGQGSTMCNLNTPGVSNGSPASAIAAQFASSIQGMGCQGASASVSSNSASTFIVTLGGTLAFNLSVGPAGSQPTCSLPGPGCTFNPTITQIELSGMDCNGNLIDDALDIASGFSQDLDENGIPDECQGGNNCPADFDGDGDVDAADLAQLLGNWGPYGSCPPYVAQDFDLDCDVDAADLAQVLGAWGACP